MKYQTYEFWHYDGLKDFPKSFQISILIWKSFRSSEMRVPDLEQIFFRQILRNSEAERLRVKGMLSLKDYFLFRKLKS